MFRYLFRSVSNNRTNNNKDDGPTDASRSLSYVEMMDVVERQNNAEQQQQGNDDNMIQSSARITMTGRDDYDDEYITKQRIGYFAILFSIVQLVVLILMVWQNGVAPFYVNPMIGPYPEVLQDWGAKDTQAIIHEGEWWRLITPIFLHAGIIHLFCNVAVQLETGAFFECEWGSPTWLIIYLSSGIGSSILSTIVMPEDAISVGSSGAVMGLFGGKLGEVICRWYEPKSTEQDKIGHSVRKEQCGAVMCSVALVMAFSFIPFVDWGAHLGGFIAGLFVGITIFACTVQNSTWRIVWFIIGITLTMITFIMALQVMYNND